MFFCKCYVFKRLVELFQYLWKYFWFLASAVARTVSPALPVASAPCSFRLFDDMPLYLGITSY